jgi:hypothetical protein
VIFFTASMLANPRDPFRNGRLGCPEKLFSAQIIIRAEGGKTGQVNNEGRIFLDRREEMKTRRGELVRSVLLRIEASALGGLNRILGNCFSRFGHLQNLNSRAFSQKKEGGHGTPVPLDV